MTTKPENLTARFDLDDDEVLRAELLRFDIGNEREPDERDDRRVELYIRKPKRS